MPGRPRTFDRDQAVRTALDAFRRDGFEQTSVARLTGEIGINPPSLYAAFGDKDGLFAEASQCYIETLRAGLAQALSQPTARAAIDALLRRTAEAHTTPGVAPGCLVYTEPRLRDERERTRATIAARLERGVRDGDLPPDADVDALAGLLDAVISGMSDRARDGGSRDDLVAIGRAALVAIPGTARPQAPSPDLPHDLATTPPAR